MSETAAQYYAQIASRAGGAAIPEVLSGQSYQMGDPTEQISVRNGSSFNVGFDYGCIIRNVGSFVVDPSAPIKPMEPLSSEREQYFHHTTPYDPNEAYLTKVTARNRLIPAKYGRHGAKLVTGHIKDVRIEAVTPDDVPQTLLERATKNHKEARGRDDNVLLVESAALVLGRTLGRVANLTVVARDESNPGWYKLTGSPFKHNELLAGSGMWQSTAIADFLTRRELDVTRVQNTGRGKGTSRNGQGH